MKITIREGREADAMLVCRLRRKVWLDSYVRPKLGFTRAKILSCYSFTDKESLAEYRALLLAAQTGGGIANSSVGFWVAEANLLKGRKKLVGFASAEQRENRLTMLYIDPLYQRRGIGGMLLAAIRAFLDKERDIVLTVVDFNVLAQNFYRKHGFVFDEGVETPTYCDSLFGAKGMRFALGIKA